MHNQQLTQLTIISQIIKTISTKHPTTGQIHTRNHTQIEAHPTKVSPTALQSNQHTLSVIKLQTTHNTIHAEPKPGYTNHAPVHQAKQLTQHSHKLRNVILYTPVNPPTNYPQAAAPTTIYTLNQKYGNVNLNEHPANSQQSINPTHNHQVTTKHNQSCLYVKHTTRPAHLHSVLQLQPSGASQQECNHSKSKPDTTQTYHNLNTNQQAFTQICARNKQSYTSQPQPRLNYLYQQSTISIHHKSNASGDLRIYYHKTF
eukprot:gene3284-2266_t